MGEVVAWLGAEETIDPELTNRRKRKGTSELDSEGVSGKWVRAAACDPLGNVYAKQTKGCRSRGR